MILTGSEECTQISGDMFTYCFKKRRISPKESASYIDLYIWKKTSSLDTSDETVQAVKVSFARKPPPSRRPIHHPTDRCRSCYLVKDILRHPTRSESSQGV